MSLAKCDFKKGLSLDQNHKGDRLYFVKFSCPHCEGKEHVARFYEAQIMNGGKISVKCPDTYRRVYLEADQFKKYVKERIDAIQRSRTAAPSRSPKRPTVQGTARKQMGQDRDGDA